MTVYHIGYDLRNDKNYDPVISTLAQLGATRYQFSSWLLSSALSAQQIYSSVRSAMDSDDILIVAEINTSNVASSDPNITLKLGLGLLATPPAVGLGSLAAGGFLGRRT